MKLFATADVVHALVHHAHAQTWNLTLCSTSCAVGSMAMLSAALSGKRLHEQCRYMPAMKIIHAPLEPGRSV